MRSADRLAGLVLFTFGVTFAAVGLRYGYGGVAGPGAGFLPFWLGLVMAALALMLLVASSRAAETVWLPRGLGRRRLVVVMGATIVYVALLKVVGMIAGIALFLIALLRFLDRYSWRTAVSVALGVAAASWLVFVAWLGVPFPVGVFGF